MDVTGQTLAKAHRFPPGIIPHPSYVSLDAIYPLGKFIPISHVYLSFYLASGSLVFLAFPSVLEGLGLGLGSTRSIDGQIDSQVMGI